MCDMPWDGLIETLSGQPCKGLGDCTLTAKLEAADEVRERPSV